MVDLINEADMLLQRCQTVSLSSVTENGYPRICIMAKIKAIGCKTIYFATGANSTKTIQYRKNSRAGVAYYEGGDSVTLLGKVTIVEDKKLKDELWQEWFIRHFPKGKDDPSYAIICFEAEIATIYIKEEFETLLL